MIQMMNLVLMDVVHLHSQLLDQVFHSFLVVNNMIFVMVPVEHQNNNVITNFIVVIIVLVKKNMMILSLVLLAKNLLVLISNLLMNLVALLLLVDKKMDAHVLIQRVKQKIIYNLSANLDLFPYHLNKLIYFVMLHLK